MGVASKQNRPSRGRRAVGVACALAAVAVSAAPAAAATLPASATRSAQAWDRSTTADAKPRKGLRPLVAPRRYAAFALDPIRLEGVLDDAPRERSSAARRAPLIVSVPTPDGGFARFAVAESPIMEPGLAAAHPEIRTYAGRGLDDPASTVRLDLSPLGFHASVHEEDRSWFVDPRYRDQSQYVSYERGAVAADPFAPFVERDGGQASPAIAGVAPPAKRAAGDVVQLRTYRLALVSDATYATAVNGQTTAAKVALMNRVNQLYESDFAIRMVLIAGNDALNLDTDADATGADGPCGAQACFTDAQLRACDTGTLDRNRLVTGLLAGARNFDIGHLLLGTDGGGIAGLGVVGAAGKAEGCTGLTQPIGDAFAVDYVAHEMGHQFGGDHTFNGNDGDCAGAGRVPETAVEPGSGTTIMAYAGICGSDDLQVHSDPYFSQASIAQMTAYVTAAGVAARSVQEAVLTGFDSTDGFRLTYDGLTSALITNGTSYTARAIKTAIEALGSGPVTVGAVGPGGFTVTFSAAAPKLLGFAAVSGAGGVFGETVAAGPTKPGGAAVATTNHVPDVSTAAGFTIPVQTPFALTASGSDVDEDPLTYLWEQNDPGSALPTGGTLLRDDLKTTGPLFRVFGTAARYAKASDARVSPSPGQNAAPTTPSRSFPDIQQVLSDTTNAATGSCAAQSGTAAVDCYSEFLPTPVWLGVAGDRVLHFRVTARDNASGGGGVGTADTALTLAPGAGPFRVTSQAQPQSVSSATLLPVTWDVARTELPPVGAANVRILLSTDDGVTFPHVLAESTPNDGAQEVDLPPVATVAGRIKIEAVGNVFFDASRKPLTITVPPGPGASPVDLGSVEQGRAGTTVVATIDNGGPGSADMGTASLAGADSAAVTIVQDGCTGKTVPANASCTVSLRLTPSRTGAHTATLVVPSNAPDSPLRVALTGTGTAVAIPPPPPEPKPEPPVTTPTTPTTPTTTTTTPTDPGNGGGSGTTPSGPVTPTDEQFAAALASRMLGGTPAVRLGTLGAVRLYGSTTWSRLGRPRPSRRLAVAVCTGQPCVVVTTGRMRTTDRKGRTTTRRIVLATLRLRSGTAAGLTLRLTAAQRRVIRRARTATILVTATAGKRSVSRRYRFTVG
jgi:hypothetical protein